MLMKLTQDHQKRPPVTLKEDYDYWVDSLIVFPIVIVSLTSMSYTLYWFFIWPEKAFKPFWNVMSKQYALMSIFNNESYKNTRRLYHDQWNR